MSLQLCDLTNSGSTHKGATHRGATQRSHTVTCYCCATVQCHNQCSEVGSARETFNPIRSGMCQTANDPGGGGGGVCSNWNFSKIDNFTAVSK